MAGKCKQKKIINRNNHTCEVLRHAAQSQLPESCEQCGQTCVQAF